MFAGIIPLQEKKGNYDGIYPHDHIHDHILFIIPLQEKIGKSYLDSLISVCAETSRAIINVVLIRSQHLLQWHMLMSCRKRQSPCMVEKARKTSSPIPLKGQGCFDSCLSDGFPVLVHVVQDLAAILRYQDQVLHPDAELAG